MINQVEVFKEEIGNPMFSQMTLGSLSIIDQVKNFVEEECKKPLSHYQGIFENHISLAARIGEDLLSNHGGDHEIVMCSIWLHDIGAIVYGRKNHHITGAEIAGLKLKEWGYPEEKVQRVKGCILSHRGSKKPLPRNVEEHLVAHADAMSAFYNIPGLFRGAFEEEKCDEAQARISVREKLQQKWEQLIFQDAREEILPLYEAAMMLLKIKWL
jgi:uncharacterized protein